METDDDKNLEPKVNLKQHQRFRRAVPWGLIRKIAIIAIMGGLIYYLMNTISESEKPVINSDGYEVEIEII